jgi:uncharacterized protein (TIGR03663 family)
MSKRAFASLFIAVFLLAAVLRTARLDLRPMHHDEANQALKFGQLLERGEYRYDPADHHGPSLYYLSLPFARALSGASLAGLSEGTLRLVTASFGLGTLLLFLLFLPLMGRAAVAWASLALAVSPAMVYFSRFYIQETILVFFLVGLVAAVWRYIRRPGWGWAAAAGLCAGMMYATKETSVIAFGGVSAGLLMARAWRKRGPVIEAEGESRPSAIPPRKAVLSHGLVALGAALIVSFLLFSSFLQNPRGFLDSILSFKVYFARAGEAGFHVQPWNYYLRIFAFSGGHGGSFWSEGLILLLGLAGAIMAFRAKSRDGADHAFLIFLAVYSALAAAVYSAIPYKTPWNLLPFYIGFILLAGSGAAALVALARGNAGKLAVAAVLAAGFAHLGFQAYRANFVYPADPRNPYVYAQTVPDFLRLVGRVENLVPLVPERRDMLIKVVAGPYETWPLPWYLRAFGRVGYWPSAADAGDIDRPPVIISSSEAAGAIEPVLSLAYRSEYYGLRPGVLLTLSIRNDIWEAFMKDRAR